jgi:hypothetical protein
MAKRAVGEVLILENYEPVGNLIQLQLRDQGVTSALCESWEEASRHNFGEGLRLVILDPEGLTWEEDAVQDFASDYIAVSVLAFTASGMERLAQLPFQQIGVVSKTSDLEPLVKEVLRLLRNGEAITKN